MKKLFYPLALLLCAPALANISALPVLQDTRCSLSLGAQEIDFGRHSRYELKQLGNGQLSPGKRQQALSVVCPFSQPMQLMLRGARASDGQLRWGEQGSVRLRLSDVRLDGQLVELMRLSEGSTSIAHELLLRPGEAFVASRGGVAQSGKMLTAQLEIEPMLPDKSGSVRQLTESQAYITLELLN